MKKFFYSVLAAATMLFATTSCSQDNEILGGDTPSGNTQKVTFKVEMPGEDVASRAIAEGVEVGKANMANKLAWALYESTKTSEAPVITGTADKEPASKEFTVEIDMVKGLEYKVLFLAYNEGGTIFDVTAGDDLKSLNYKTSVSSNTEAYDAFAACHTHKVNEEAVTTVTLYRPFAQINAATTDADLVKAEKLSATVVESELVIKNVPTQYNVLTGEVSEYGDITYTKTAILKDYSTQKNEILKDVDGKDYNYLNMVYVLAGNGTQTSSTHEATFNFYRDNDQTPVRVITVPNLPIERNWRTNLIGDLLTQTESFKIVIDENFKGDHNILEGEVAPVATVEDLQAAIDKADGPTIIKFTQDIDANSTAIGSKAATNAASITITQKEGVDLVIDGCNFKFNGTFYLHGQARYTGTETLKFQNINFEHKEDGEFDFISCNETGSVERYAHNVTVENCTFTGNGKAEAVAMRYRQCYNMSVINTQATGLHSLMWATGGNGITIDNVTIDNSKNGASFGTTDNIEVKNSNFTSNGAFAYAIRVDATGAYNMIVKNSTLKADVPILLRKTTGTYKLALDGNTLTTTKEYQVIACNNDYEEGKTLEEPTGNYTISGAEGLKMFPVRVLHEESGLIYNGVDQNWKSVFYLYSVEDFQKAATYFFSQTHTNEANGVTFVLENDVDFNNVEWTPWSVMWITLEGNNHTISNVKVTEGWRSGFFGYLGAAKVNNLTLENVNVAGAQVGILAGSVEGVTTTNVKIAGTNSVTYKEYVSETWGGIGAVTGVLVNSTINAEIVEGAKVTLNYNDIETEATYKSYKTGYLESNKGTVVENGEIIQNGTIQYGSVAYSVSEDGTSATFSAVGEDAKTVRGIVAHPDKIEEVVVEEGIETIGERTFRDMPNLKTVTLPNTVTTFEEGAFQACGIKDLTVPESVTYMGKQSIGYLPNLEKIVINAKNVTIANYIARSCPKLKEVIINSETVTFETGSMYFTNKENADASGITFYVKNQSIAETLYTAFSTSHSYGLKIVSIDGNTEFYNTLK